MEHTAYTSISLLVYPTEQYRQLSVAQSLEYMALCVPRFWISGFYQQ